MIKKICVAGAGTMGSGIALAAAQNNFKTVLFDTNEKGIETAKKSILKNLDFLLSKDKISAEQKEEIYNSIFFTTDINECVGDLIIEAIIEDLQIKETLYKSLAAINSPQTFWGKLKNQIAYGQTQTYQKKYRCNNCNNLFADLPLSI